MLPLQTMREQQHHVPASPERAAQQGVHDDRRFVFSIASLACALLVMTLGYAFVIPLTPGRMTLASITLIRTIPLWSWIATALPVLPANSRLIVGVLVALNVIGFAAYACAVYLCWNRVADVRRVALIVATALLCFSVSAWALPTADTDIFNYIANGRVATAHASNPYYVPVDRFPNDPIYPYAGKQYTATPDNKLPTWMLITLPLNTLAGNDPTVNLLVFRFAFLLFNIANLALITLILRSMQPRFVLAGAALYGWNPIIIEQGQSKTDTVMAFFLLAAIFLLTRNRRYPAMVALSLSVYIKLLTLPLVIVYWLRSLRRGQWRELGIKFVVFGLTTILLYAPFVRGPGLLLEHLGLLRSGGASASPAGRIALAAAYLAVIVWAGLARHENPAQLVRGFVVVTLFFSLFLTRIQFAWYLITLIALASLAAQPLVASITIMLSFVSFVINQWDATATGGFTLPHLSALPRSYAYFSLSMLIVLGVVVFAAQRRLRQRHAHR